MSFKALFKNLLLTQVTMHALLRLSKKYVLKKPAIWGKLSLPSSLLYLWLSWLYRNLLTLNVTCPVGHWDSKRIICVCLSVLFKRGLIQQ